jgi:hypothetical protein
MRLEVALYAFSLISVRSTSAVAQDCNAPHYRWPEKTSVALLGSASQPVTISAMLRWRAPEIGPGRAFWCAPRTGVERRVLSVVGWVRRVDKTKEDGDWHIELTERPRDRVSDCIVVEIPMANLHPAFRAARARLDSALTGRSPDRRGDLAKPIQLRFVGPAFFDGEHLSRKGRLQQHGRCWSTVGALWEIHPVYRIERP